jgi:hypothetical protein
MSISDYKNVTTEDTVNLYNSSRDIFKGLLKEVRELSKKKPEATLSASKVKIINRVLNDLLVFLPKEPEGKYLEVLDDAALPQVSDAVLIMVQFETALAGFTSRYHRHVRELDGTRWITSELLADLKKRGGT